MCFRRTLQPVRTVGPQILQCFLRESVKLAFRGILLKLPVPCGGVEFQEPGPELGQLLRRELGDRTRFLGSYSFPELTPRGSGDADAEGVSTRAHDGSAGTSSEKQQVTFIV